MSEITDKDLATELLQDGSDLAGAATGAAIGLLGGPVAVVGGAAAGVAITRTLKTVGAELKKRLTGPREEARVGATFAFAVQIIAQYTAAGRKVRNDGFFDPAPDNRVPAEEILEGVLLKARDAYEQRKLQLLGKLYANIAFHSEISADYANQLVNLVGQLTYRQLVALGVAYEQGVKGPVLKEADFRDEEARKKLSLDEISLLTEIYELYQRGLIHGASGSAWISLTDVNPGDMRAQGAGSVLEQLVGLDAIPSADRSEFYRLFPRD